MNFHTNSTITTWVMDDTFGVMVPEILPLLSDVPHDAPENVLVIEGDCRTVPSGAIGNIHLINTQNPEVIVLVLFMYPFIG